MSLKLSHVQFHWFGQDEIYDIRDRDKKQYHTFNYCFYAMEVVKVVVI